MSEIYTNNCFQLFINGRIYAIFPTEQRAKFVLQALSELGLVYESEIRLAYIENTGFYMKVDLETYEPHKPVRFWCGRCDARVVDSEDKNTGNFFLMNGHSYSKKDLEYEGDYNVVMFAFCKACLSI